MKPSRFIRFYFLLFVAAFLLIATFSHFYKEYFSPPLYYSVNIDDVFSALQENDPPEFRILDWGDIQLGTDLTEKLKQGEIIAFTLRDRRYFLKSLNEEQLMQWGSIPASDWQEPGDDFALFLFYCLLALLFLILLRPLFRDIDRLQKDAIAFRRNPSSQPLKTKRSSSVYPLARELYRMSHELLDLVQVHKDLANIIAHELRTPLSRMQFTLKRIEKIIPDKERRQLHADIRALDVLAHEYLEFGQHHRSDHDYFQAMHISELIATLEEKFEHSSPKLEVFFHAEDKVIRGNPAQIELAITNLVNNGMRYANDRIQLHVALRDELLTFSVEDDGPGFKAEIVSTTQVNTHKSFGLGLYIVKNVALHHGGTLITGSSQLGGAKAQLSIPVFPEEAPGAWEQAGSYS